MTFLESPRALSGSPSLSYTAARESNNVLSPPSLLAFMA